MDTIRIDTGEKRIMVNDDPNRVIVFNPSDTLFAERFYNLIGELETKSREYESRGKEIDSCNELDGYGIPVNTAEHIDFLKEICTYMREKIDTLFGKGTSQAAFGDAMAIEMFEQFFEGITPFIKTARAKRVGKYTNTATRKKHKKK